MAENTATSERRKTDLSDSIKELEAKYQKEPNQTASQLAKAYLTSGRPKDAIPVLQKSGQGKPENQVLLAQAFFDSFQNSKATKTLRSAMKKADLTNHLETQLLLGELALEYNKPDDAKTHLRTVMKLKPSHTRAASLLHGLGENIAIPKNDEDYELSGFRTESATHSETPFRAITQIVLATLLLGGALGTYVWNAQRNHAAKTLAVEAMPLVERGDIESLQEAEAKFLEMIELTGDNPRAIGGLAYLNALLWVDHGVQEAQEKAERYTQEASRAHIESSNRYAAELLTAYGAGDLKRAEQIATLVSSKGGVSEKIHWGLGLVLEAKGETRLARDYYRKAHDLKASVPYFAISLGDAYNALHDPYNAATFWTKAQAANSSYIPGAARELLIKLRKGEPSAKIEETLKRLEAMPAELIGPRDRTALNATRGALAYREGDAKSALEYFTQAMTTDKDNPELLLGAGLARIAAANGDDAATMISAGLTQIKAAYAASPKGTRYLYAQLDALISTARYDEAIKAIQALKPETAGTADESNTANLFDTALVQVKLGNAYRLNKDFANATKAFEQALKLHTDYPEAHLGIATSLWNQKKHSEAIKSFEAAVGAKSKFPEVYDSIGLMFLEQGAPKDADIQLVEADKLYRGMGKGKRELSAFYTRVIEAYKARRQTTLAGQWQKRLEGLAQTPATITTSARTE